MRRRRLAARAPKESPMPGNSRTSRSTFVVATLKSLGIRPNPRGSSPTVREGSIRTLMVNSKKRFGQNFLVNRGVADRIIAAVAPRSDETIIEIGAGRGALTSRLLETTGRVVAIEFDRELIPSLREKFSGAANLKLIEA